jgi:hypothetical protein
MPVNPDPRYQGKRIAKKPENSYIDGPEGAAVLFHPREGYYYLFLSYGWLGDDYDVRVGRSREITGPYLDYRGRSLDGGGWGMKLAGSYRFHSENPRAAEDEPGWQFAGFRGPGHGVPFRDPMSGEYFFVHHIRDGAQVFRKSEWGRDMELSTSDYEKYMNHILEGREEMGQESIQGMHGLDEKRLEKCSRYQDLLHRHAMDIEEFVQRIYPIVEKSDNYILRSGWSEYFTTLQEVMDLMGQYEGGIPVEAFEKLMPRIDRIEELKQTIEKQAARAGTEQKSAAAAESGFFGGCDTLDKLEKRYRALCKTYHPDTEAGDEDTFKRVTEEYEKRKAEING